jgi:hypothetical protein
MRVFWSISKWAFVGLLALWILMITAKVLIPDFSDRADVGCYWTDGLVLYVVCSGFFGKNALAFIFNLPLWVFFYAGLFLWYEISDGVLFKFALKEPQTLLMEVAAVCWLVLELLYPFEWLRIRLGDIAKLNFPSSSPAPASTRRSTDTRRPRPRIAVMKRPTAAP